MSKRLKAAILILSVLLAVFAVGGSWGVRAATGNQGAYAQLGVYSEVVSRVRSEYVEEPNMALVNDGALHGLLESLDANSSYLNPAEYKQYKDRRNDSKAGIGATLSKRFGYGTVVSVIKGGPADKAGLSDGDIVEAIGDKSTRDMSLAEIESLMVGQKGSNVSLSVVRARRAAPMKVTLTRDEIAIPAATEKMLDSGVGYIRVEALNKGKAAEIAARIKSLTHAGARKLVLDLRNVSQGEPAEGIAVANLFLNHGEIAHLQGQKYPRETFTADPQKDVTALPLAVLVNRGTAGAAEIVAGAILENARGDVVGDKTFGAGSVQKLIDIPGGAALILTVAKYYTQSGKAIQDTAITPSVMVSDNDDDAVLPDDEEGNPDNAAPEKAPQREDEPLKRAVELLKGKNG